MPKGMKTPGILALVEAEYPNYLLNKPEPGVYPPERMEMQA